MFKFDAFFLHINLCSNKKAATELSWLSHFHGPFSESVAYLLDSEPNS